MVFVVFVVMRVLATDPTKTPQRCLKANVTALHAKFSEKEVNKDHLAPAFMYEGRRIGIKQFAHFDFSCVDEKGERTSLYGYCRARKYADDRSPSNNWWLFSLLKSNRVCQRCSNCEVTVYS